MWLQDLLVGIIVLLAAVFAAWRLPGNATRLRYLRWLKRHSGEKNIVHRWAGQREMRILGTVGGACSGCSAEGDHQPVPSKPLRK
ncbi:MAG TPA: hypothetical protein VN645_08845 [Steroidobacteraceae bacterium]|nr:hypothetical protein [Steroidobacteraceae bacterium]